MAEPIEVRPPNAIPSLRAKIIREVKAEMAVQALEMATHIRKDHMTGGTTPTKLKARTGHLRASVKPEPVKMAGGTISTGISVGYIYGRIHFGRRGSKTKIVPKNRQYLTGESWRRALPGRRRDRRSLADRPAPGCGGRRSSPGRRREISSSSGSR
jgi:hypothetical protein